MKAGLLFVISLCVVLCSAKTRWYELENYTFFDYVQEYNKYYETKGEYLIREALFYQKLHQIKQFNSEGHSWKKGVNHLTDMTENEFQATLGFDKGLGAKFLSESIPTTEFKEDRTSTPSSIDWRDHQIITDVKDQGKCGSCWTFGSTEAIESYWAMATGELSDLSEQQIASCTPNPNDCGGTGGCEGGIAEIAYNQIKSMGGLSSHWTYPYISYQGKDFQCWFDKANTPPVAQISGYVTLPTNDYTSVLNALGNNGPLVVNVDASRWGDYEEGVFNGCNQASPDVDHVVQLVGYGTDDEAGDYWLIRNSWNPKWGEDGYIRLSRPGPDNVPCGVDVVPLEGTGCNGGASNVTVCGTCGVLYSVTYPIIDTSFVASNE